MISRSLERPDRTVSRASDARNRYKIRYTTTQHRPPSRQVNDHGRVSGTHRVGSSADNAVAEAFFSTLKRELVHHHSYPDRATARRSIFEWLIGYNTHRLHTSLGNQTPDDYEHHYRHTAGTKPALTT